MLKIGTTVPKFDLQASTGERISLDSLAGHNAVIVFYPANNTPG